MRGITERLLEKMNLIDVEESDKIEVELEERR